MVLSVEPRSVLHSYVFLVATLLFGLPLAISYYAVNEGLGYAPLAVAVYVAGSLAVSLVLLIRRKTPDLAQPPAPGTTPLPRANGTSAILAFLALACASGAVASLGLMKYFVSASYPFPSSDANLAGAVYLLFVFLAAVIGIPLLVSGAFPVVREALANGRLKLVAFVTGAAYFFTYELLVNEIVVVGYNTSPSNFVPSPLGSYPWAYVFTSGPSPANLVENAIYSPYVLIQVNQSVNLIFQPFEVVLAIAASALVAATVAVTYHVIRRSERMGGACSASATLSGVGAFLGYTATCPSCLAPTLVSVMFGGLASLQSVQAAYSNLWGVVLPPLVSIGALLLSLAVLQRSYGGETSRAALGPPDRPIVRVSRPRKSPGTPGTRLSQK